MAAPKGNQNAAKSKVVHDALRKACVQEDYRRLNAGIEMVLNEVERGDHWAIEFFRDSLDGKPKQQTELTGEGGGAILLEAIERVIVDPK